MFVRRFVLFVALVLGSAAVSARTIQMQVNGLVCAFCAQGIEKRMKKFDATAGVFVSLEHRIVAIALKEGTDISDAELEHAITESGYALVKVARSDESLADLKARVAREAQP